LPGERLPLLQQRGLATSRPQNGLKAEEPTRGQRRRARDTGRAGQHNLGRPAGLDEIMGGDPDAAFRGRDAETAAHRPRHPGIVGGIAGPDALVEPAQDHQIRAL